MTEVVLLISSLIFADLQNRVDQHASAKALLREAESFGAEINYASAIPNPEKPETIYLTVQIDSNTQQFANNVRELDGVYSSYVKPEVERP